MWWVLQSIIVSIIVIALLHCGWDYLKTNYSTHKTKDISKIHSEKYENIKAIPAMIVDSGRILTGGGVSLCIDTVLYVLEKNFGKQKVSEISRIMEYSHARNANQASFSTVIF
jgi:hypothetical protein